MCTPELLVGDLGSIGFGSGPGLLLDAVGEPGDLRLLGDGPVLALGGGQVPLEAAQGRCQGRAVVPASPSRRGHDLLPGLLEPVLQFGPLCVELLLPGAEGSELIQGPLVLDRQGPLLLRPLWGVGELGPCSLGAAAGDRGGDRVGLGGAAGGGRRGVTGCGQGGVGGVLSDRLRVRVRVRVPFMLFGAVGALVFTLIVRYETPHTDVSYSAWAFLLVGIGTYGGFAFACWMASFTETVEAKNPALIAHGLAVWGWLLRIIVAIAFLVLPQIINSVTPLVEHGAAVKVAAAREAKILPTVQANQKLLNSVAARYPDGNVPDDVAKQVVEAVGADVATALQTPQAKADFGPDGPLGKYGASVSQAQKDSPGQWQDWFLVCALGQLFFIPMVFVLKGPWSPRKAREEAEAHAAAVDAELRQMTAPSVDIAQQREATDGRRTTQTS